MLYIIVPCFNEAQRIQKEIFAKTIYPGKELCFVFVNDGSDDGTDEILSDLSRETHIEVVTLEFNVGKANAIYHGYLSIKDSLKPGDSIAYIDADLSTSVEEILRLESFGKSSSMVMGSRITSRENKGKIAKRFHRYMFGRTISLFLSSVFRLRFYDTQCGAKVIGYNLASMAFSRPFKTRWFVDVEIILRVGKEKVEEYPLMNWKHVGGGSISLYSIPSIITDTLRLLWSYKLKKDQYLKT